MLKGLATLFELGEDGWQTATIPEARGSFSQGKAKEEARAVALDAVTAVIAARREVALRQGMPESQVERAPIAGEPSVGLGIPDTLQVAGTSVRLMSPWCCGDVLSRASELRS